MRTALFACLFAVTACDSSTPPPPLPDTRTEAPAPWFICDAIDAPALLVFHRDGKTARVVQYDKPNGALIQSTEYDLGDPEGAAGSIYTPLTQNGEDAGLVRQGNPGMLENPASAYTPPFTSVRLGDREITCRWMPRTRLMGFTGRRTIVVHEDQDGDLIYTSYDFADAAETQQIELSENARTTRFSLEVRDGAEALSPEGARYEFRADTETDIIITAHRNRTGSIEVRRHGPDPVQSESFIAFIEGEGVAP